MKHPPERDWMIVAPWWRWTDPATVPPGQPVTPDLKQGRLSRPVFQKYDSAKLVNDFLADPQRCLKFVDEDLVHALRSAPPPSVSFAGKLFRITATKDPDGTVVDQVYVPDGTGTRKIFLDIHKRFYLVVCEMHCDGPGFPKVGRDKICQAGFVIRRRTVTPPSCGIDEVKPILRRLQTGRVRLGRVNQLAAVESAALATAAGRKAGPGETTPKLESLLRTRASLQALVAEERARFDSWVEKFGVVPQLQGWLTSAQGLDKVGCWAEVEEMPNDLGLEASFPLHPLIPDKNDPEHAGHYGTVYFGTLPTSSHDCEISGRPRFDDQEFYEIRCWVKRHKVPHDPDQPCPCPDGLFWSVPTRPYKLASHYDLAGTSHHPVTIQLPDLKALAAQATPSLGVGLAKPPGTLMISGDKDGKPQDPGRSKGFEICFIPIPLLMIVAAFLFDLFLPVVMLIFQLWWMIALRFCIPPQIEVDAGINAELGASGSFGISADLTVDASLELTLDPLVKPSLSQFGADAATDLEATYSPIALANLEVEVHAASDGTPGAAPSAAAGLDFEAEVTHA